MPKKRAPSKRTFMIRTSTIYRHQVKRARDEMSYTIDEFRHHVQAAIDAGRCPYCLGTLDALNFGADHAVPLTRGGLWTLDNLAICCMPCNTIKGPLAAGEYAELLAWVRSLPEAIGDHVLSRIKAGSRIAKAPRK